MIKVVNLRNYKIEDGWKLVRVDRSSVLGNPFKMLDSSHQERHRVCDRYEALFNYIISSKDEFVEAVPGYRINCKVFRQALKEIVDAVSQGQDIALGCWCFPKRCHALHIAEYVRNHAK